MARVKVTLVSGPPLFGEMSDTSYAHLSAALRGEISSPHRSEGYTIEVGSRRVQFAPSDVVDVDRKG